MLKKLKTKYIDFISESLYTKDIDLLLKDISKNSPVASLLSFLSHSDIYKDENTVNFLSLSNTINTLNYIPTNRRGLTNNTIWDSTGLVEMRIGRVVKKILSDIDKSKFTFTYKGKISYENGTFWNGRISSPVISFSNNLTGDDFAKMIESDDNPPISNDAVGVNTYVNIKLTGENVLSDDGFIKTPNRSYNLKIDKFYDMCYKNTWSSSDVYFKMTLSDKLEIDDGVYECELVFSTKFCGKEIDEINDAEIEKFVNTMSAEIKMLRSSDDSKIEVVNGEDIRKWYNSENYQSKYGQLGSSCMSYADCQNFFDIYTNNPDVISLLILKNTEGKLIGRALLWKLIGGEFFMDRVYCATEYDEIIFTKYAKENGYYYRKNGGNSDIKFLFNDVDVSETFSSKLIANLSTGGVDFDYYPYLDTLKRLDLNKKMLFYRGNTNLREDKELTDTEGRWANYDDGDDYNDYDDDY